MTEWLYFHFSLSCIGEGNGNPLQYSCLENPRDGGAWWAAIYGVTQSRTRLKRLSSSSSILKKKKPPPGLNQKADTMPSFNMVCKCLEGRMQSPATNKTEAELDGSSLPLTVLILYHTPLTWFVSMYLNCKMQGQELPSTSVIFFFPLKQKTHTFQTKPHAEIERLSIRKLRKAEHSTECWRGAGRVRKPHVLASCQLFLLIGRVSQLQL